MCARTPSNAKKIDRIIMDELVCGVLKRDAVTYFQQVIEELINPGFKPGDYCRACRIEFDPLPRSIPKLAGFQPSPTGTLTG
jgi:hypothetical protein